jgi:aryl-alcohol dehydrogenase-like predicted oxidoreductase
LKPLTNKIILGTVQLGLPYGINNKQGQPSADEALRLLDAAYDMGIRSLDTADAYGDALSVISRYHQSNSTKRFEVNNKFSGDIKDPDLLISKVNEQLASLRLSCFDHYLFHRAGDIMDTALVEIMKTLKAKQLARNIGISVYTNKEFRDAIDAPFISSIQLPFNLLDNHNKRGALMKEARLKNKEIHVRSVFLQGFFFMNEADLPSNLSPLSPYLKRIRSVADDNRIPVSQLALQYVLQNEHVDKVLIGADNTAQLEANIRSVNSVLPSSVLSFIDEINVEEENLLSPVNW